MNDRDSDWLTAVAVALGVVAFLAIVATLVGMAVLTWRAVL